LRDYSRNRATICSGENQTGYRDFIPHFPHHGWLSACIQAMLARRWQKWTGNPMWTGEPIRQE
jgi:hypothetical protein